MWTLKTINRCYVDMTNRLANGVTVTFAQSDVRVDIHWIDEVSTCEYDWIRTPVGIMAVEHRRIFSSLISRFPIEQLKTDCTQTNDVQEAFLSDLTLSGEGSEVYSLFHCLSTHPEPDNRNSFTSVRFTVHKGTRSYVFRGALSTCYASSIIKIPKANGESKIKDVQITLPICIAQRQMSMGDMTHLAVGDVILFNTVDISTQGIGSLVIGGKTFHGVTVDGTEGRYRIQI
ncbi:hypothetical protein CSB62_23685 [Vibrio splendidus]|uniref:Uncharacterized protein n=2 Tax=Vibrio lentus TaxID=136468 RepID=A0A2J6UHC3_9VIBR|nr:hypothetical protein [Vibrio lentus]PHN83500.1 hypothetical protein CSB62_23685 [Vibrio splendidus]MCB5361992.1 FliM/FliN family flagellar motor switch protein [Vibrio lentus]MCB5452327.1 FliM/FliN family flagellar motor switch protein [Vibrio lentus]MCC4794848.1 hypothetical protein [Vibrio lentus]MCC4817906.1 hypothetical protein [Vibrio lentus]